MDVQTLFGAHSSSRLVEHLVPLKRSASIAMKKIALIVLAILWAIVPFAVAVVSFRPLMSLLPFLYLAGGALVWYLWRFVNVEYEYTILGSEMDVDVIYGQKQRKSLCSLDLKQATKIAPYEKIQASLNRGGDLRQSIFAAADLSDENTYGIVFSDPQKGKTVLYVDAPEKVLNAFVRANPSLVEKR